MRQFLLTLLALVGLTLHAEFTPPPAPKSWVTDQPNVLNKQTKSAITQELIGLEKKNSCQVIVYITKTHGEVPLKEWTHACARAWGVGQKDLDNGAILFVFTHDHEIRLEMGTRLEGIFPDLICGDITSKLKEKLDAKKVNEGFSEAVHSIAARAASEYKAPEGWKGPERSTFGSLDAKTYLALGALILAIVLVIWCFHLFGFIDFDILSFIFGFIFGQLLGGSSSSSSGSSFGGGGGDFSGGGSDD